MPRPMAESAIHPTRDRRSARPRGRAGAHRRLRGGGRRERAGGRRRGGPSRRARGAGRARRRRADRSWQHRGRHAPGPQVQGVDALRSPDRRRHGAARARDRASGDHARGLDRDRPRLPAHGTLPRRARLPSGRPRDRDQLRGHHRALPDRRSRHRGRTHRHGAVHADRRLRVRRRHGQGERRRAARTCWWTGSRPPCAR